jgi:hypothetical protein
MLKQDTINKLAALAKVKPEDLTAAIKAEAETDVTIDEKLTVFSEDEVQALKSNSYKDGKKAGVEMEVDDIKKELGLEFTGKTVKGLIEAHKTHVIKEAKIEPGERVKELETKLSTIQETVKTYEKQLTEKSLEVESTKVKTDLYRYIPQPSEEGPALDQDDIINLMKNKGYEFKLEEGKTVAYKGGAKVIDNVGNNIAPKDVVQGFLKESKLVASETPIVGGRGGGDKKPPAKAGSVGELKKQFEVQGKSTLGQEFSSAFAEAAKDPEFKTTE